MLLKLKTAFIKHKYLYTFVLIFSVWFYFSLPQPLFGNVYSTILLDKKNQLLNARISGDGQWRFPESDSVPYKFKQAIIQFEDAYFYKHFGVNPVSLMRALMQDIKARKIVSGGSTISMQVIRMARGNRSRNLYQKLMEILLAIRLEISYSKNEILCLYASHAPFGGNVVGVDAAAWRYYGRSSDKLSWGEAATLAVLPNAPSLIYPGKNHKILRKKRNRLLEKLRDEKIIDSITCELAKSEPLPQKPKALPQFASHLLTRANKEGYSGKKIRSTVDKNLQIQVQQIADRHHRYLSANKIDNLGILVMDVETGNILSYIGNSKGHDKNSGYDVDMTMANRSTGSLIKPFLYALAMKDGIILPKTLLKDIPTQISGYHPKNYNKTYDGAVPADNALARSLNIPAVRLLRTYGLDKFHDKLQSLNLSTINKPAGHYGLTLILGGAEIKLWEVVGVYGSMARVLKHYNQNGKYSQSDYFMPKYIDRTLRKKQIVSNDFFGAGSIWFTFKALSDKDRPTEGGDWNIYRSAQKIAWKTGTSFGHRDAWCVGVTPKYAVGVWVGNADGEGRPGLTGTQSAAPIMFDIFKLLPSGEWFHKPLGDLMQARVCKQSGYLASPNCEDTALQDIPKNGEKTLVCPYHELIHLNKSGTRRVNSSCCDVSAMQTVSGFVLPPVMGWYYRHKNPQYKPLPPWKSGCQVDEQKTMDLIYPKAHTQIFIPKDFNHQQQKIVLKAAHSIPQTSIYWHLDDKFIGQTKSLHQLEIYTYAGMHTLTLVDANGQVLKRKFEVVNR